MTHDEEMTDILLLQTAPWRLSYTNKQITDLFEVIADRKTSF